MDVVEIAFPCIPEYVGVVRTLAKAIFGKVERGEAAEMITSELATNAVRHSRSRHGGNATARFLIGEGFGRIEMIDDGADAAPIPEDERDERRRGLSAVVNGYADKWGHDAEAGQSVYWAELYWG